MTTISRIAISAMVAGSLAAAGLGLAAGNASADDYYWFSWCPGQIAPSAASDRVIDWDWNVCHTYRYNGNDLIDDLGIVYPAPAPAPGSICGTDLFTGIPIYC